MREILIMLLIVLLVNGITWGSLAVLMVNFGLVGLIFWCIGLPAIGAAVTFAILRWTR